MANTVQDERRATPQLSDVIGTALLGVIGLVAAVMGWGYGFTEEGGEVGPGFLPVVTGGFIVVASLTEIARLYFAPRLKEAAVGGEEEEVVDQASSESGEEVDTFGRVKSERQWAIIKIFGLLLVALALVPFLGLLLSLTSMVFFVVFWVEKQGLVTAAVCSVSAAAIAYALFVQLLGVPVPQGMLGLI